MIQGTHPKIKLLPYGWCPFRSLIAWLEHQSFIRTGSYAAIYLPEPLLLGYRRLHRCCTLLTLHHSLLGLMKLLFFLSRSSLTRQECHSSAYPPCTRAVALAGTACLAQTTFLTATGKFASAFSYKATSHLEPTASCQNQCVKLVTRRLIHVDCSRLLFSASHT